MGLGQLVKRSRHQMGHDHQGDEKEGEVHLHVGFQMEAKDAANEDHGDLADDHGELPPVKTKRREKSAYKKTWTNAQRHELTTKPCI